jgi:hypothetical protein
MNQLPAQPDGQYTERSDRSWRALLQIGPLAVLCALLLARAPSPDRLQARRVASAVPGADRAATAHQSTAEPVTGLARPDTRWILRHGKRLHVYYVAFGWDDPNDDETSDDPTDDDDGWEGLTAVSETEAPVFAWFQAESCRHCDLEARAEAAWSAPHLPTSFLMLQRLRC